MVQRRARFLDVRARVRTLPPLQQWSERKQKLGDREKEKRGAPQSSRKHA
jgi:hypothetical protein